jgi:hypothetical protein
MQIDQEWFIQSFNWIVTIVLTPWKTLTPLGLNVISLDAIVF